MELNQEEIEILDRYLKNELSATELSAFQSRMKNAEFAEAIKSYLETIESIENAGRLEMRQLFTAIHTDLQSSGKLDEYKPTNNNSGGGSSGGSGGLITTIIVIVISIVGYLYYTGKLNQESFHEMFQGTDKIDTIFHYQEKTDTIITVYTDSIARQPVRKIISIDTTYSTGRIMEIDSNGFKTIIQ